MICAIRNTFKAYERLKREQHIDTLFRTGKAFSVFPVKFVYQAVPRDAAEVSPIRVGFSVPKKKFRLSVDRHRVRRLMVEAWRLNKHQLYAAVPADKQLHVFIIFVDPKMPTHQNAVTEVVVKGIQRLMKECVALANLTIKPEP